MSIYSVYLPPETHYPDRVPDSLKHKIAFLSDGKAVLALFWPVRPYLP